MINRILNNRYEIIELIGRGGMAYVYKAKDRKLNRYVAVKVLREEYTENEQFIKKFDRESQASAGLSHPHIVSVYDVGVEGDIYYIIMEFVDGITLKQYLNKKGRLDYKEATRFVIDVAAAIKCAHEHKIIHRDIKPHNILLTRDLVPKVADFGIARAITSSTVTMTNQTMGSVHYISPEQARGGFVDERSDLYSLGIMYYELLTGQLPFDEENTVTIAIKHIQEELVPPKEIMPDIPQSVNDVVVKLAHKKPDDRYQNMDELIEDLEQIMVDANAIVGGTSSIKNTDESQIVGDDGLFKIEPVTGPIDNTYEDDYEDDLVTAQKNKKKKIIIFSVLGAILLIGLVAFAINSIASKPILVPEITNMTQDQARQELEKLGLKLEVEKEVFSSEIEAGKIATQNPEKGRETQKGKTLKVNISKGPQSVIVPVVVGLTEEEATSALDNIKLVKNVKREYNSSVKTGVVYAVEPTEGVSVAEGTKITLYVSKGQDLVSVPGVVGLSESAAGSQIETSGLDYNISARSESDTVSAGLVISQSVSEGTQIERGTTINLVISTGKPTPSPTVTPTPSVKPSPSVTPTPTTPPTPTPTPTPTP